LNRHLNPLGIKTLKDDIEITTGLDLPILLMWMNEKSALERFERDEIAYSTAIIKVRSKTIADQYIVKGIDFSGKNCEKYTSIQHICICLHNQSMII
jgi:hypothetical protein